MLTLTRKTDYALVALAYLGGRHATADPSASARRIAEEFRLPLPLLMNLLKELAHAGIVAATRGAQGGYALTREPAAVNLLDVVEAIEGPVRLAACAPGNSTGGDDRNLSAGDPPEAGSNGCDLACRCPVRRPIQRLHGRITRFLAEVTLADLMETRVDLTLERERGVPAVVTV